MIEGIQSMANATGAALKTSSNSCSSLAGCAVESVRSKIRVVALRSVAVPIATH